MFLAALCLARRHPAGPVHRRAGTGQFPPIGARMPAQIGTQWLSIVPIAASRSSYDGLLVFLFIAHRARSPRRHPPLRLGSFAPRARLGCGYPDANPATQYSAMSFAQPIRRVFGRSCSAPASCVNAAARRHRPARLKSSCTISIWDYLYAPIATGIGSPPTVSIACSS